ncbi:hypothetical protein PC129_g10714 [Phytophthora cactorum]|uniref:Uncharacterized protein n=3 Tax=Phytophthora TaxID=4783 RepID=A0A329SK12_9STRA|nr:hypothetical protein Pcac1_g11630 [Phytophthora cactorum]KAG6969511.1 hypothetical protein JG688_00005288 [Phytophthora aleatoria]KAG2816277.1 hypothetical protein PC112_g13521 [Phytophthora cactorum]KAG2818283.1 hypothetical protein PC111_g12362 [Phytophthora cactorum]KAG2855019.1 hypothetical protein PC113_g12806 [Phytophthora cactorum]
MDYLDAARRGPWVVVYLAAGVGVLVNLLGEAYINALDVCEMYPHFSFQETLREELGMHHTRLPLVRVQVPTLHLLGAYIVAYAAKHWGLLDRGWPLLLDLLSGRWLYHQVFEVLPTYLPFVFSEPDVPELLSEDEARGLDEDEDDGYLDDVPPPPPVDDDACNEALAKLVQVKMQHANRTIPRPDDWLVFDPVQEKLVLQKHATHMNGCAINGHSNGHTAGSKVSLPRAQEPIGDEQASMSAVAAAMRVEKEVDSMNQPQEVVTGTRTRL